jgi:hypothetical protein
MFLDNLLFDSKGVCAGKLHESHYVRTALARHAYVISQAALTRTWPHRPSASEVFAKQNSA